MSKIKPKTSRKVTFVLAVIMLASYNCVAFAATYYASPTGSGSTCSNASPCTVTGGLQKMSSGDTLILKDGTYTGTSNMIGDYASPQTWPPSGSAGAFTTVKAENVGQAIIDAQYARYACSALIDQRKPIISISTAFILSVVPVVFSAGTRSYMDQQLWF